MVYTILFCVSKPLIQTQAFRFNSLSIVHCRQYQHHHPLHTLKMPSTLQTISAIAAAAASVNAAMGPALSTGPVADSTFIRESTATLVLPEVPTNNKGDASLWVGMGTSNGDLIQSISDNYNSDKWSIYAYTLVSLGEGNGQTVVQDDTPTEAGAGDEVTMHCKHPKK